MKDQEEELDEQAGTIQQLEQVTGNSIGKVFKPLHNYYHVFNRHDIANSYDLTKVFISSFMCKFISIFILVLSAVHTSVYIIMLVCAIICIKNYY